MSNRPLEEIDLKLTPIGVIESVLSNVEDAPCQGFQEHLKSGLRSIRM